jgi:hypothetical protein
MKHLQNSQELLCLFGDIESSGYLDCIPLNDRKVGFSVQKKYPSNIQFKPVKTRDGEDDDIAVIWVVYDEFKQASTSHLIPLRLRIAKMSKYRAKNWEYNFDDEDCPSKESVLQSNECLQPIELNSVDEYFYDTNNNLIVDSNKIEVSGVTILNKLFEYHCRSVHPVKGLGIRGKVKIQKGIFSLFEKLIKIIVYILKIFDRRLVEHIERSVYFEGYSNIDLKRIELDSIEVGGYRASKNVIVIFSLIIAGVAFWLLPLKENTYLGALIHSEFLMVIHSLLLLIILDEIIPRILLWGINLIIKARKLYFQKLMKNSF